STEPPARRAAVMRDRKLSVADVPVPQPGPGEVLVRTLACGICGSDLHALKHAEQFVETSRRAGGRPMDLRRDVVMGHEFCAEIVEHGPGAARTLPVGARVCSRPVLIRDTGPQTIGYSNEHPGGYGAVGPAKPTPWESWRQVATVWREPSRAPQAPPWLPGPPARPAVVFECVGVPGVLDQIMAAAPRGSRIVVVGVCMEADAIHPMLGIVKELSLQFVLGYTQEEFAATLGHIAEGRIPTTPLITGRVGIDGVAQAFEALASPERHAKIVVQTGSDDGRSPSGNAIL